MSDKLPGKWQTGGGEANRPLSDGGYYMHYYTRTLPGSNQYVTRGLEMVVDTIGMPPREHVIELSERVYDDNGTISEEIIETDSVTVQDPQKETEQGHTEETIHERAEELMEQHP